MTDYTKLCNGCKQPKDMHGFHINRNSKDGLQEHCKECASRRGKLHYKKKKTKEEIVGWNGDTEIYL